MRRNGGFQHVPQLPLFGERHAIFIYTIYNANVRCTRIFRWKYSIEKPYLCLLGK